MRVKLIPKTAKAKQRIKAFGDTGDVLALMDKIPAKDGKGPWLLVEAADPTSRWVHQTRDLDFEVVRL